VGLASIIVIAERQGGIMASVFRSAARSRATAILILTAGSSMAAPAQSVLPCRLIG